MRAIFGRLIRFSDHGDEYLMSEPGSDAGCTILVQLDGLVAFVLVVILWATLLYLGLIQMVQS